MRGSATQRRSRVRSARRAVPGQKDRIERRAERLDRLERIYVTGASLRIALDRLIDDALR